MAICSFQTMSQRLTALSDNCIDIMVGDGARFGVACDPLSIPIRAITLLNASLIFQSFSHANLARIPEKMRIYHGPNLAYFPSPSRAHAPVHSTSTAALPLEKSKAGLLPPDLLTEPHTALHRTLYLLGHPAPSGRSCSFPSHRARESAWPRLDRSRTAS